MKCQISVGMKKNIPMRNRDRGILWQLHNITNHFGHKVLRKAIATLEGLPLRPSRNPAPLIRACWQGSRVRTGPASLRPAGPSYLVTTCSFASPCGSHSHNRSQPSTSKSSLPDEGRERETESNERVRENEETVYGIGDEAIPGVFPIPTDMH